MRRDNFTCYQYILAVDPGYSAKNGTGYAIFDHETHRLKKCGLIQPFAGTESYKSTYEITKKLHLMWEKEVGFSYDPEILCIEHPQTCFIRNGVRVSAKSIFMLVVLCTRIEDSFKAKTVLRAAPGRTSKDKKREYVLNTLDAWSQKALARDLADIQPQLHHNVFDAIALGLWIINAKNRQSQLKKNGLKQNILPA